MQYQEVNFDGLIGPSHNYAGLAPGNLASDSHKGQLSYPREAALQGLEKMWLLHQMGFAQGVLPPAPRPDIQTLRALGFSGDDRRVIEQANTSAPHLLAACYSAASMWTANAATVTAGPDSPDGRLHFTPANLQSAFHRSLEHRHTAEALQRIFADPDYFCHHPVLPCQEDFADEGAANHTRLCPAYGKPGINLLVYGRSDGCIEPLLYPARQTRKACDALVRQHQLPVDNYLLAQQNPEVIDLGVFHHDVIGVGNRNVIMLHQRALVDQTLIMGELQRRWQKLNPGLEAELKVVEFSDRLIPVKQAVDCYLFNSQLLSRHDGSMLLLAPDHCQRSVTALQAVEWLLAGDNPVTEVVYTDVTQSMNNGGGPACLRLRVPMSDREMHACHQGVLLDFTLYTRLKSWIEKHYRDQISPADLNDPQLPLEICTALDELTEIIQLPGLYPFQV